MARTQAAPMRPRYFAPLGTTQDWDEASELIARYLPIVHHIVRRYHCSSNDREDLYQEGCLVILEAARDYRVSVEETFERFVTRAIERRLRQCRRATVRVASHESHSWDELEEIEALLTKDRGQGASGIGAPPAKEPADFVQVVDAQWLDWVMTQLTSLQKHVVMRYFMEGATEQEIANELGIRQQSVNAAKRGAISKLRKLVQ
jgi:RNA polymerase sporulation-specific sigma factor